MIITISGLIGSGKTTVANSMARSLKMRRVSAGEIFREMARERGMTVVEFAKLAEDNKEIDREIDKRQVEEAKDGDVIIDGRLSGYLTDADFKVWLSAPIEVRAKRVAGREGVSYDEALKDIKKRETSDIERYKALYSIDLTNLSIYDVVLNTSLWDAEKVVEILEAMLGSMRGR